MAVRTVCRCSPISALHSFSTERQHPAERQRLELYEWIANDGAPTAAERFVSSIIEYCKRLVDMPMIGAATDDIRPGLRTVGLRHRAVATFRLAGTPITILGVFYGGQDYQARLAVEG